MLFCGGAGPEYPFPANAAHAVLVVLILALWAAALCLVRVGTVRLRNRGVYTVGVIDALFRPVRHWATPRTWRREQSSKFVACFGLLIFFASSLRDQLNEVAYLADPAGQTLATRNLQGPILLAGMVLDALAVGIASGLILGAWRRRSRQRPWFIPAAWVGRRP